MTTTITETNTAELIKEANQLYDVIYNVDCFGTRDLIRLNQIEKELENRGYLITQSSKLAFERIG
jgi:hypothetical protein